MSILGCFSILILDLATSFLSNTTAYTVYIMKQLLKGYQPSACLITFCCLSSDSPDILYVAFKAAGKTLGEGIEAKCKKSGESVSLNNKKQSKIKSPYVSYFRGHSIIEAYVNQTAFDLSSV